MSTSEKRSPGYSVRRFSTNRRMVAVNSALAANKHTIHLVTETDVTVARQLMREHRSRTGESISFTGYIATCLGRVVGEYPSFNSFRKGRRIYLLDDVTVSVAVERVANGESIPQPIPIRDINSKTLLQVSNQIRQAQREYGTDADQKQTSDTTRFVPDWALRAFARLIIRDPGVVQQVGVIGVSSVGMFAPDATWLMPLAPTTVMVSVGSIVRRPALMEGALVEREAVCLTASFDHDIIDGAPAARFVARFGEILTSAEDIRALMA